MSYLRSLPRRLLGSAQPSHAVVDSAGNPVSVGARCVIADCRFGPHVRLAADVTAVGCEIGDYTYVEAGTHLMRVSVGKFCSVAPRAFIGLGSHPSRDFVSTHPAFSVSMPEAGYDFVEADARQAYEPTRVGNDVWVGVAALIRDGLSIGDGAVIGAGAVVTKDVPPYAVVAGVPARVLRYRFDEEQIGFLLGFRWWDRSEPWLRKNAAKFRDITRFVREADDQ